MAIEIERKFLPKNDGWRKSIRKTYQIEQGYPEFGPRVRIRDDEAFLTIKHRKSEISSYEWEYKIPMDDARQMMNLSKIKLQKKRHLVDLDGHTWEVDEYEGDKFNGLIVAEIELSSENENFTLPTWAGEEVSGQKKYTNKSLAKMFSSEK